MNKLQISIANDISFELTAAETVRCVDDVGRIAIPKAVRRLMKLDEGDEFAVYYNAETNTILFKGGTPFTTPKY